MPSCQQNPLLLQLLSALIPLPLHTMHIMRLQLNTPDAMPFKLMRADTLPFAKQAGTSGCTVEAAQFREHQKEFDGMGAKIVGISGDSPKDLDMFQ